MDEHIEYLAIVPQSEDALLRLSTDNRYKRSNDAANWVESFAVIQRKKNRTVVPAQHGEFRGHLVEFEADGEWLRGWALSAGEFPLCVHYRCQTENAGRDDSIVDEMLKTLCFADHQ